MTDMSTTEALSVHGPKWAVSAEHDDCNGTRVHNPAATYWIGRTTTVDLGNGAELETYLVGWTNHDDPATQRATHVNIAARGLDREFTVEGLETLGRAILQRAAEYRTAIAAEN